MPPRVLLQQGLPEAALEVASQARVQTQGDFKPGDYACLDAKKVVDPAEYDDLAQHVGVGHGIWLIVGVLASYDDGRNVRVTMDGRDATSKVFGREVLCRLPPSSPAFDPQKLPLAPK